VKARQEAGGRGQEDYNPILKPDLVLSTSAWGFSDFNLG